MLLLFSNLKGFILICGYFPFLMPLFILCSFLIYIFFLVLLYISIFITPVCLCHAEKVRHEAGEVLICHPTTKESITCVSHCE